MMVNNLIGNSTMLLWKKLEGWVLSLRDQIDDPAAFEWFQWLFDRLQDYKKAADTRSGPAYATEADWLPTHIKDNL